MITVQDIEEAIQSVEKIWASTDDFDHLAVPLTTLVRVAQAMLELRTQVIKRSEDNTYPSIYRFAMGSMWGMIDTLLINPAQYQAPKNDLQKVREWAESKRPSLATYDDLLSFIDQLEVEKKGKKPCD